MFSKLLLYSLYLGCCFSQSATLDLSKAKNELTFLAIGQPSALKIKGTAKEPGGLSGIMTIEKNKIHGTATLKLSTLETGITLRDRHMKEKYLEVQKFPLAELQLSDVIFTSEETPFKGTLKLHGVSQTISGKSKGEKNGAELSFQLSFVALLKDFSIEIPSYLGIRVANEVKISASSEGNVL